MTQAARKTNADPDRLRNLKPLPIETPCWTLSTTDDDLRAVPVAELAAMLEQVFLIRHFEERLLDLSKEGLLHGPAHASIGQEGAAVGIMSALASEDKINGTHRMHHQFLAKTLNHARVEGYNPLEQEFSQQSQEVLFSTYSEILGLSTGYCGGRGGSMHLREPQAGVLGSNAIVGGNPPHAVGYSLADKMRGSDSISVAFFGDGATQMGTTYEAMNLAALYDTSTVFVIENNLYAVSTHLSEQTRETRLSARGLALGIPAITFDGMDVIAARRAMEIARDLMTQDKGPVILEARTYRHFHQSGPMRGSAFGYRDKDEEQAWLERDPAKNFPAQLERLGLLDEQAVEQLRDRAQNAVDSTLDRLIEGSAADRRLIPSLWPDPTTVEFGIRGDLSELADRRALEEQDIAEDESREARFQDIISESMLLNMDRYENLFIMGEDVHRLRGGTAGATRGIGEKYPDRLLGTPICENGFTGVALGAALNGMRPVVEIMYPDFALVAADQLFNQIAKVRHMFGGGFPVPVVVRSRVTQGTGYGSQHSMDAAGLFTQYPGWRIVAASTPHDYIGLLNAAVACDDPVLVLEYHELFPKKGRVPTTDWDYIVPFGKARIARAGRDATILTYGPMVDICTDVADNAGLDAEVIDLRTLDPLGLDWTTIQASVEKTNALLVVEQTTRGTSIGSRIVNDAQRRLFNLLDYEIMHVTGTESSAVVSKVLEEVAFARPQDVEAALRKVIEDRNLHRSEGAQ
ncbi:thiamine pyrophosphate-dependent enzyme [Roseovarius sp. MMSF_3281]|uniref:alpha-ketoacid dehydrogenase subunit alpha/beta n=1 Tax=Roseovarius sp. MMSF_3281 TaxID=3046694 RepID=UPI00273EC7EA|nr:alpha-ketoacid dehydrogenase subunit alpha/beta [Roseovarius sp. MMSF_3281]